MCMSASAAPYGDQLVDGVREGLFAGDDGAEFQAPHLAAHDLRSVQGDRRKPRPQLPLGSFGAGRTGARLPRIRCVREKATGVETLPWADAGAGFLDRGAMGWRNS